MARNTGGMFLNRVLKNSVRCTMLAADDVEKQLSGGDRLSDSVLRVNAVTDEAVAQYGDLSITADIASNVKGKWSAVFQDLLAELLLERIVFQIIPLKDGQPAPRKKHVE